MNKTKVAVGIFNKYAEKYQDKFMDVSLYHSTFDAFCHAITKQNATVLELACGPGNITKYLLDKRPDFRILGTDLAPKMLELSRVNNPSANFELMDCRDINKLNEKYDGLMCGFCFPYLSKEEAIDLINDAYSLLNENGVIYISTMEDDYTKSGLKAGSSGEEIFMHYHEGAYLSKALEAAGFTIIDLKRQDFPTTDSTKVTDLIVVGRK